MDSIPKETKKFKSQDKIKLILNNLIESNKDKISPDIKEICVSQVKSLIIRALNKYDRLIKIYWIINAKNKNYKKSSGIEEYSASDIYNIVSKLLENDGHKKVCRRTFERDLKLLNESGLIKSKIRKFGKNKGSISHYIQNMELDHIHKEIILEYLKEDLKEKLKNKKIVGDFDKDYKNTTFNYRNLERLNILPKLSQHNNISQMSHVGNPAVFNKANISYINNKNSKELLLEKTVSIKPKVRECKFKRNDVEMRLVSKHKISKRYLIQVKECSNNDATYINALINLERAIIEYKSEYNIEDILQHFLKQFSNRYKYKVWMMMKRRDGIVSDYELIWEGRFRDWYPNKYNSNYRPKETYGEHIQVKSRASVVKGMRDKHLSLKGREKIEKQSEEKRRLEIKRREEYLSKLFEREAMERKERLRRAREENACLREQARASMFATLEKSRAGNMGVDTENKINNLKPYNRGCSLSGPLGPVVLNRNFEGFKTTKGLSISNLGTLVSSEDDNLKFR
ncbi:plasmid maintenance protein (plasmid) [Borrelia puertoricensis]|uniref:plasmid maintenance protein n=1 Tax=Borrelia puertoricensis TaxID=2756107 RepID=UPI003EBEF885